MKRQLLKGYRGSDLCSAGLNIFTTLDLQTQLVAEQAVKSELVPYFPAFCHEKQEVH